MSRRSCAAFRSGLQAAAAPDAGDARAARALAHASACAECGRELASTRRLLLAVAREADTEAEPPPGFVDRVLAGLPRRPPGVARGMGRLAWVLPIAALAPLLLLPLPGMDAPEQFAAARAALDALAAGAARVFAVLRALEWTPTWQGAGGGSSIGVAPLGLVLVAGGLLAAAAAVLLAAAPGTRRQRR